MSEQRKREKINALLGMPGGTASARLRKILLFSLAQRLELTGCFRCNKPIETVDDFTIDHKKGWIGSPDPIATFFDLGNIAFSHARCNISAAFRHRKYATAKEKWTERDRLRSADPVKRVAWNAKRKERRQRRRDAGLRVT